MRTFHHWRLAPIALVAFPIIALGGDLPLQSETPEAFIESVSKFKHFTTYQASKLQAAIDAFNQSQMVRYRVDPDYRFSEPKGYAQARFEDLGPYVALKFEQVEVAHNNADQIDGGYNLYFSAFWAKRPPRFVARLNGLTYSFSDPRLQLVVPARTGCNGDEPLGNLQVFDLESGETLFDESLPPGAMGVSTEFGSEPFELIVGHYTEEPMPTTGENEHLCDIGLWSERSSIEHALRCEPEKASCTLRHIKTEITHGCPSVGECD